MFESEYMHVDEHEDEEEEEEEGEEEERNHTTPSMTTRTAASHQRARRSGVHRIRIPWECKSRKTVACHLGNWRKSSKQSRATKDSSRAACVSFIAETMPYHEVPILIYSPFFHLSFPLLSCFPSLSLNHLNHRRQMSCLTNTTNKLLRE